MVFLAAVFGSVAYLVINLIKLSSWQLLLIACGLFVLSSAVLFCAIKLKKLFKFLKELK